MPGQGSLSERFDKFRSQFTIPKDRLDATFKAAIEGCRSRTLAHLSLPAGESFVVEYVTNKSWSGYNWYKGNYHSVIQVNTDLPIFADRAIDLACHEGYPGHHVYNVLLEKTLVRDRGWVEFSVYPLRSPQSLIAEGSANYGIDIAFPTAETPVRALGDLSSRRSRPGGCRRLLCSAESRRSIVVPGNEAARRYLNGQIDAAAAAKWLERYGLYSPPRAQQLLRHVGRFGAGRLAHGLRIRLVALDHLFHRLAAVLDARLDEREIDRRDASLARDLLDARCVRSRMKPAGTRSTRSAASSTHASSEKQRILLRVARDQLLAVAELDGGARRPPSAAARAACRSPPR